MAVKILIKRKFKESDPNKISKMLTTARYGAMQQEGYISSETMWDHDDPHKVVVASMWQTIENWNKWKNRLSFYIAKLCSRASGSPIMAMFL